MQTGRASDAQMNMQYVIPPCGRIEQDAYGCISCLYTCVKEEEEEEEDNTYKHINIRKTVVVRREKKGC